MKPFKVRDFRNKQFFMVDDAYLNGYAKYLGPAKSVVYLSLCRHADKEQVSFPSEELIAKEFSISIRTVASAIALLKKWNIISVERERSKSGKWLRNSYSLLDKSEWKDPHATDAPGDPHANNDKKPHAKNHMHQLHLKDTYIEGNTYNMKDTQRFVEKIIDWAYTRASTAPSIPKEKYRELIEKAVSVHGEKAVYDLYKDEVNAITLITNIKYL